MTPASDNRRTRPEPHPPGQYRSPVLPGQLLIHPSPSRPAKDANVMPANDRRPQTAATRVLRRSPGLGCCQDCGQTFLHTALTPAGVSIPCRDEGQRIRTAAAPIPPGS